MTKGGEVNANVSPFLLGVALCGTEQIKGPISGSSLGSPGMAEGTGRDIEDNFHDERLLCFAHKFRSAALRADSDLLLGN